MSARDPHNRTREDSANHSQPNATTSITYTITTAHDSGASCNEAWSKYAAGYLVKEECSRASQHGRRGVGVRRRQRLSAVVAQACPQELELRRNRLRVAIDRVERAGHLADRLQDPRCACSRGRRAAVADLSSGGATVVASSSLVVLALAAVARGAAALRGEGVVVVVAAATATVTAARAAAGGARARAQARSATPAASARVVVLWLPAVVGWRRGRGGARPVVRLDDGDSVDHGRALVVLVDVVLERVVGVVIARVGVGLGLATAAARPAAAMGGGGSAAHPIDIIADIRGAAGGAPAAASLATVVGRVATAAGIIDVIVGGAAPASAARRCGRGVAALATRAAVVVAIVVSVGVAVAVIIVAVVVVVVVVVRVVVSERVSARAPEAAVAYAPDVAAVDAQLARRVAGAPVPEARENRTSWVGYTTQGHYLGEGRRRRVRVGTSFPRCALHLRRQVTARPSLDG